MRSNIQPIFAVLLIGIFSSIAAQDISDAEYEKPLGKNFFFKIVTDPNVDPRKCAVGMACAAQAVRDGHNVEIFFASHAVLLLQEAYLNALDRRASTPAGTCRGFFSTLVEGGAGIHCSTGSQAVVGVTPDDPDQVLIQGYNLNWSSPQGVVALSCSSEVQLVY